MNNMADVLNAFPSDFAMWTTIDQTEYLRQRGCNEQDIQDMLDIVDVSVDVPEPSYE